MFYTYVLFSKKLHLYYIGATSNLKKHFLQHKSGLSQWTSQANDWEIIYYEAYLLKKLAFRREKSLKKRAEAWRALRKRFLNRR